MSYYEKDGWRQRNVEFLKGVRIGTYAETIGDNGHKMYKLLTPYLDSPKQFIGFDNNRRCIYLHRASNPPWYCSYTVDAFAACNQLAKMTKSQRIEAGLTEHPLNICNFDLQRNVGNVTWWNREGSLLPSIVDGMLAQSPEVCIILNHTLDWNKREPTENIPVHTALINHTERLCGLFRDWEGAYPDIVLGRQQKNLEGILRGATRSHQWLAKYEIYISDRSTLRMATLRIRFEAARRRMLFWSASRRN